MIIGSPYIEPADVNVTDAEIDQYYKDLEEQAGVNHEQSSND